MRIQSSPNRLATWKAISSRISGAREEKLKEEGETRKEDRSGSTASISLPRDEREVTHEALGRTMLSL